nr:cell division protein FtsA [Pseudobdellovibrionaceae bacterium]
SDPIGMSGVRLEASVQIITGSATAIQNTIKCVEKADLKVAGLVLESLAASYAILSEDEKNLGVCLIDMGGGITNLLYYSQGSVHHASTIPVGGQHFTHDVAVGLRTPQVSADDLKKKYGCAMASMISESETIEVEGVGGRNPRTIPRKDLADVIEARAEEILSLVGNDIRMSGLLPLLGSGVVFTGGASQLEGLVEMGEFVFDVPVRRGSPNKVKGLVDAVKSSEFATAVGLVLYALEQKKDTINQKMDNQFSESIDDVAKKVKSFFEQLF